MLLRQEGWLEWNDERVESGERGRQGQREEGRRATNTASRFFPSKLDFLHFTLDRTRKKKKSDVLIRRRLCEVCD